MKRLAHFIILMTALMLTAACASKVPVDEPAPQPISAPPAEAAAIPAGQVTLPVATSKGALGRLGLASSPPEGMCWLESNASDADLFVKLAGDLDASILQPIAMAVDCEQMKTWKQNPQQLPSNYLLVTQKMNERVGGGGANQAKERWIMVQALGGTFGFFPQDQYNRRAYLTGQAEKLQPGQKLQLGEIRRDDMALYTVELLRPLSGENHFVMTQYSQLRGTPVAMVWHRPLSAVDSISRQVLATSSFLAALIRQSDDPRLAPVTPPAATGIAPPAAVVTPPAPAVVTPPPAAPPATTGDAGQLAAESLIGGRATPTASQDITGWEKASFGINYTNLTQAYTLSNPIREDARGQAYYLKDRNAAFAGLQFRVLFDFSDSPLGPGRLGRIIFSNTTSGGNVSAQKEALVKSLSDLYGAPDKNNNTDPVLWNRTSGQATLQMIASNGDTVWLIVLEAKNK